jgi:hypothetical protein
VQTFRRIRRSIAAVLLMLYLPGCYHWRLAYLGPSEMANKRVRVTDSAGKHLTLHMLWVSGDSLIGRGYDGRSLTRDTIGIPMAQVVQVQVEKYKGPMDPATAMPAVAKGAKAVRVTTAAGRVRLEKPWVMGDSLLGYRATNGTGSADTILVALEAIRRLERREFNTGLGLGGGLAALGGGVLLAIIVCSGGHCSMQ